MFLDVVFHRPLVTKHALVLRWDQYIASRNGSIHDDVLGWMKCARADICIVVRGAPGIAYYVECSDDFFAQERGCGNKKHDENEALKRIDGPRSTRARSTRR